MNKIQVIAEVAQAHEGSLGIAHSYIDALAETGVNAIKFQTHIAEAESSEFEPFRIPFSYEDKSRYDYWKRMEFTIEQWAGLKLHCEKKNLEFISSPFSNAAVDLLKRIGVKKFKIGSGEVNNHLLLETTGLAASDIILSSGMSSFAELDLAIAQLRNYPCSISLLQCTTAYPTRPEQWGLNIIGELKNRYHIPIGFSDHSGNIFACLAATALGAEILEFHAVFDKRMFGPDTIASLSIDEIQNLVNGIRQIERSLNVKIDKTKTGEFVELKNIFEKSLAVNKTLKPGHILKLEDIESKKPKGKGIDASEYKNVIGKRLTNEKQQWDFLNINDLSDAE